MLRLLTIPISHYCEKARWALDRAGLSYSEERHVQGIHSIAARRAGGGGTVPVLVTDAGVIGESAEIVEWVDARTAPEHRLLPAEGDQREAVRAFGRRLDERLGPSGRRLMYVHVFAQHRELMSYNNRGVPPWEDRAIRWCWPLAELTVRRVLDIRDGVEVQDEAHVWRELDHVAEQLGDGRPYLFGERFGAADLTFAALAAPVLLPPIYGVPLPQPETLAPAFAAIVLRAREHPAGRFAMRVIAEQRGARGAAAAVAA
ncbi:MAG TPA: glutathione S-transferase family protein [Solirubrobacteraceae bacterium]|nr:glutathione S-transferase family protein [Solirubrobacteraceae bacterium]